MKEDKLIVLLDVFTPQELRSLKDFVASPFFNKNEKVTKLINFLLENQKDTLNENALFEIVYPDSTFDAAQWSRLKYLAIALVEQFVMTYHYKKQNDYTALLNFYAEHNLEDFFLKTYQKYNQPIEKKSPKHSRLYHTKFQLAEVMARFQTQYQQRNGIVDLHQMEENLNVYFIAQKLEMACTGLSRKGVIITDYQPEMLSEVIQYIENHSHILQYPVVQVYYHLYLMLRNLQQTNLFEKAYQVVKNHQTLFMHEELNNLYSYLRNYCIAKINQGNQIFENQLFDIYQTQLTEGTLYDLKGNLSQVYFKNIVVLALRLQQTDWTSEFLATYTEKLPKQVRNETFQYCQARLLFSQKDFKAVNQLLANHHFEDIFFNIDARKLLIQNYFELQEWDLLQAAMNRFRVFLHRNKTISEAHKTANRNFINILSKIIENQHNPTQIDIRPLIEQTKPLAEKNWLIEIC